MRILTIASSQVCQRRCFLLSTAIKEMKCVKSSRIRDLGDKLSHHSDQVIHAILEHHAREQDNAICKENLHLQHPRWRTICILFWKRIVVLIMREGGITRCNWGLLCNRCSRLHVMAPAIQSFQLNGDSVKATEGRAWKLKARALMVFWETLNSRFLLELRLIGYHSFADGKFATSATLALCQLLQSLF